MCRELGNCSYPKHFVDSVLQQSSRPSEPAGPPCRSRAPIPYVPGVSESLARVLRSYDVPVAHILARKLRHELVAVKDGIKKEKFPGVVYKIPCADCDFRSYEHKNDMKNKKIASNALAEHVEATTHKIYWDEASVIARERKLLSHRHLEEKTLNHNAGNFPPTYARCLGRLLRRTS